MALFPQGKTAVDRRCNTGERKLFNVLKRQLGDDYYVWHDLPVGDAGLQPDFVILSPRQGLLVLEVKDWKRSTLAGADRHGVELDTPRGRVSDHHPLAQARKYAMALVDRMQRDEALVHAEGPFKGKLLFPYGWGTVLTNIRRAELTDPAFADLFPENRTLLRDDLDEEVDAARFGERLWGMMTMHFPHTLSMPQRDRIRWHLFPALRVDMQQPLPLETAAPTPSSSLLRTRDLMHVMDMQQEREARRLGDGHRVIHGVAGSGKTMILVFRAHYLAAAAAAVGRPVLVLCYNRALAGRIARLLEERGVGGPDQGVVVRTFHSWCEDMVRTYQLSVRAPRGSDAYFVELANTVERALSTGFIPKGQYTAVMIDEAHDFEDAWLRMATELVNPATKALLVLYDHTQSIYRKQRRKTSLASLGIQVQGGRRSTILRLNYRNTTEILSLALRCTQGLIAGDPQPSTPVDDDSELGELLIKGNSEDGGPPLVHPDTAGRPGPLPVLYEAASERAEAQWQASRIAQLHAEGVPLSQIAVLFRYRPSMQGLERALAQAGIPFESMRTLRPAQLQWKDEAVRLLTIHSAKGLEFSHVLLGAVHSFSGNSGEAQEEEMRLLYVAMTRATLWLAMSAHRKSPAVVHMREQLAQLTAEWSAMG